MEPASELSPRLMVLLREATDDERERLTLDCFSVEAAVELRWKTPGFERLGGRPGRLADMEASSFGHLAGTSGSIFSSLFRLGATTDAIIIIDRALDIELLEALLSLSSLRFFCLLS
jgi:hypothetical protein